MGKNRLLLSDVFTTMQNAQLIRVLILGVLAIFGIISVQSYWVTSSWNINEQEFDEKVNYILYYTACSLADFNGAELPKKDIIKRRTSNYYIVNIDSEINPVVLESFLQEEMEAWTLNVDFEYAIYDCTSNEMVYGNYCQYELRGKPSPQTTPELPKSNTLTSNYYFGVRFPTRSNYLLSKMQLSIFFSLILLLTILFFAYSMYVLLRQNRIAQRQKEFINNMTHEFKTPLSTVKIAADVFLKHPRIQEEPRLSTYAQIIKDQNQRLNEQVERVLLLAKFEKDNFLLKKEPIPLPAFLQDIVEKQRVRLEDLGGQISLDLPEQQLTIEADPFHLSNILNNLIDNSIKYSRDKPEINLQLREENKRLRLSIRDKGIGIPKEFQNLIFEKFYRVPTGNIHNVRGFGIGLYYVKRICRAHRWDIKLISEVNQYTRFEIEIPYKNT